VWTSSKELDEAEMREVSFEPDLPLPIQKSADGKKTRPKPGASKAHQRSVDDIAHN
jgi:hypothetical protein